MNQLSVKLSLLTQRTMPLSPQVFLERSPENAIAALLATFPPQQAAVIWFACPPHALQLLLENEWTVCPGQKSILPIHEQLTANSWLWMNGLTQRPQFDAATESQLETLLEGLWQQTAKATTHHELIEYRIELRRELDVLLRLHLSRVQGPYEATLNRLTHADGRRQFLYLVVAEAMYKTDAMRALLGPDAAYTKAWQQKQQTYMRFAHLFEPRLQAQTA